MAIPNRGQTSCATYFITAGTWCKMNLLQLQRMADLLCVTLFGYRAKNKFLVHAFVVMPNHVHLLISVPEGATLERSLQLIKGGFSREAGKLLRLPHPFWQNSFVDRRVRDGAEFERLVGYIDSNPVKAGLCSSAEDYSYSSANPRFALDPVPQRLKPVAQEAECMHR